MHWPEDMTPQHAPVYALNEIVIPAEPARIWPWLVQAKRWPEWYSNCAWLRMDADELAPGVEFTWRTFGVVVQSKVLVFEPNVAIEWDAKGPAGLRAYHGWRIDYDGHESHVVTEEAQTGILPSVGRAFLNGNLKRGHQIWVESLKRQVTGEPAGA